jgi:hypothetical protein
MSDHLVQQFANLKLIPQEIKLKLGDFKIISVDNFAVILNCVNNTRHIVPLKSSRYVHNTTEYL